MWQAPIVVDAKDLDGGASSMPAQEPHSPERTFARRMRLERVRRRWRQEDLADKLAERGMRVHPSAIARSERETDARMIRLDEAVLVASIFGLTVDQMVNREDMDVQAESEDLYAQLSEIQRRRDAVRQTLSEAEEEARLLAEQAARLEWALEAMRAMRS
jgi:transcriptional regulator with XRE-family HTH domain